MYVENLRSNCVLDVNSKRQIKIICGYLKLHTQLVYIQEHWNLIYPFTGFTASFKHYFRGQVYCAPELGKEPFMSGTFTFKERGRESSSSYQITPMFPLETLEKETQGKKRTKTHCFWFLIVF